jgi:flagellar basal-body rod protein FlgF
MRPEESNGCLGISLAVLIAVKFVCDQGEISDEIEHASLEKIPNSSHKTTGDIDMSGGIYMAASGALAYEKRLEILSNNLANANTSGYKRDNAYFKPFVLPPDTGVAPENTATSDQAQAPEFWSQLYSETDFSAGSLKNTGGEFDLALVGKGFFCVQAPDGNRYTRSGNFMLNSEGVLVSREGWPVAGDGGEIEIKAKGVAIEKVQFSVDEQGNVFVDGSQKGRLRLVDFQNPGGLEKVGNTYFKSKSPDDEGAEVEEIQVAQGFLEDSNVEVVRIMTEMIEVLRGYEAYQKVIKSIDDTNSKAINEVGKTA